MRRGVLLLLTACAARTSNSHPATAIAIDGGAIIVTPEKPSRCPKIARKIKAAVTPAQSSYCYPLNRDDVEKVDRMLRRRFTAPTKLHKLVIDYGCDTIGETAFDAIDFEQGWAHGGSFTLFRLTPTSWPDFHVRAVRFACQPSCGVEYARTEIDGRKIVAALPLVRTGLLARMHDVELYQPGYFSSLISGAWVDQHLSLEIANGESVIGRRWTGPTGLDGQEEWIPLEVASGPISNALQSVKFESGIATELDRKLFAERFAAAFDGGTPKNGWVLGVLLAMAEELGTIEQLPFILPLLELPDGDVTRDRAIDAVAALTTLDLRKDEAGNERPRAEVAVDYLRECRF